MSREPRMKLEFISMKPSLRIKELYKEWNTWPDSIIDFLDEEYENRGVSEHSTLKDKCLCPAFNSDGKGGFVKNTSCEHDSNVSERNDLINELIVDVSSCMKECIIRPEPYLWMLDLLKSKKK